MIGTKLGPYEITAKLGEGGMGEVYRATDTKLERQVAIKVLPAAFVEDHERLARFEREAKLLAQLHHPNVASIFGMEESEGTKALVMELVEGPTLADRLESGPLPLEESLSLSRQIAEALEEAHEKGIIHRDLKPQNIKASIEGKVKVLDFGLAKAMDPTSAASGPSSASQLAASPTLTLGATQMGVILGTAAYMSPEQAKGAAVDKRADIWAFGVVLYEMLSGHRLFAGDSVPETLAGVLKTEIDFAELPDQVPPAIRRLLRRCLQRQPHDRLRDIGDARLVIADCLAGTLDERPTTADADAAAPPSGHRRWLPLVAAAALLAGALGFLWGTKRAPVGESARAERRFAIAAQGRSPADRQALAPDGGRIVYSAGGALWLRALGEIEPRKIAGGEEGKDPFWSPDGREIGFVRRGALWRLGVDGGSARRICDLPAGVFDGGTWGDDGMVTFALATGGWTGNLEQCPAAGGNARTFLATETVGLRFERPQALPGGGGLLFSVDDRSSKGEVRIFVGGASRVLLRATSSIHSAVLASGRKLFYSQRRPTGTDLWSLTLDKQLKGPVGEPVLVAQNGDAPTVASDGALLYSVVESPPRRLALVGRDGSASPVGEPFFSDVGNDEFRISPDGTRATMTLDDTRGLDASQIWIADLATGARQRVPVDFTAAQAEWSPDGRELLITGEQRGNLIFPMSGGGAPRKLESGMPMFESSYTPDGKSIVFYSITAESGRDLFRIAADGGSAPEPVLREPGQQTNPDVSPDGRFLAYQSDESGRPEIYVRTYPAGDRKWEVTSGGATSPLWSKRGGELLWLADNSIWSAPVRTAGGDFEAGAPQLVLNGDALGADLTSGAIYYSRMYDLSSDGRTFALAQQAGEGRNEMVYVENPGGGTP